MVRERKEIKGGGELGSAIETYSSITTSKQSHVPCQSNKKKKRTKGKTCFVIFLSRHIFIIQNGRHPFQSCSR